MTNLNKEEFLLNLTLKYKEKNIFLAYGFLAILGVFGFHRFYLEKYWSGLIMFVLTISWLMSWVSGIWILFDIYFVYKYVEDHNTEIKLLKLKEIQEFNIKLKEEEKEEITIENY